MSKIFIKLSMATSLIALTSAASAQSINYGDLQDLFGEPVTTSATGKPQRQSEAPASMIIITGDEVRRSGVRTIPDILQNYAGIDVNRYATGQREMTVRGGNLPFNPRLLVLINGRQAYLDHYGYTDWTLLGVEMAEIQQIEVVKGPNSALFGFNAVAGVVNIITVDPLAVGNKFSGTVQAGSNGSLALSGMASIKVGESAALKLSAGMHEEDDWDDITTGIYKPQRQNLSGQFTAQITDKIRATASYTYAASKQAVQGFVYGMRNPDSTFEGLNGVIAADTKVGQIKTQVFYNKLDQTFDTFGFNNDILSVKVEDLIKAGMHHTFRFGAEYRRNEYNLKNNTSGTTYYDVFAASGMWEWQATDKITLTNALRVDRLNLGHTEINEPLFPRTPEDYDKSYTELSYNTSLSYVLDDQTRIRVSAARGVQAPSLNALGVQIGFPGVSISGNPNLEPGITKSYEVAFDRSIPSLNGGFNITGSMMDVSDFQAASQNLIFEQVIAGGIVVLTEGSVGDFKTYAIEATLNGRSSNDKLGWSVNYTWTDVKEAFLTDVLENAISMDEGTATHKINVKFDYVDGPWSAYVAGRYRSETDQRIPDADGNIALDGNVTFDARAAYTMTSGLSLWVTGENVTSNNAAGLSVFRAESRFLVGVGFDF